ncbi:enterochelin esterase [bacterium]|nr:enterochelin esterase [bacterium]
MMMNILHNRLCSQRLVALLWLTITVFASLPLSAADRWSFSVQFAGSVHKEPYSGRVYLIFSETNDEPRTGPSWFTPEQFLSVEVSDWKPDTPLTVTSSQTEGMLAYPVPLEQMNLAGFRAQAVTRFNSWERKIGTGPGNGYSNVIRIERTGEQSPLLIRTLVPKPEFSETRWSKLLTVRSERLSKFYGREVLQNAAVILPQSYYEQPQRQYPTIYTVPGFGGDHLRYALDKPIEEDNPGNVEFIRVMLDPSCPLGHHVFADSANNGPRGQCLIDEFIPEFERQFRAIPTPQARFLTGHSSGGWSSLWVQVAYPDHFNGTWSTAPDPVDFRDFQRINLYQSGENMYVDSEGQPRPLARINGVVRLWYKGFAEMEWALGPGGQLHSFEAVFSPRGQDGTPLLIWDRSTGKVNTDVAKTWEKYDIRLVLERNWPELEPKLKGKLHVIMGDQDTFYLEGATILLKESLEKLGSDAAIEIVPGRDHFNLLTEPLLVRIRHEMANRFLATQEK